MRWLWATALALPAVAAAGGQATVSDALAQAPSAELAPPHGIASLTPFPRGLLPVSPLPAAAAHGDHFGLAADGTPMELRGLLLADDASIEGRALWDLAPADAARLAIALVSNGLNAVSVRPAEHINPGRAEMVLDEFAQQGLRVLLRVRGGSELPTAWKVLSQHRAVSVLREGAEDGQPLVLEDLSRDAFAEASIRGVLGVLLSHSPFPPAEDLLFLASFALWQETVPWADLTSGVEAVPNLPPAMRGLKRGDEGGRHLLLWIHPDADEPTGPRTVTLSVAPEPLLVDVFSLGTSLRRRFPVRGPTAAIELARSEWERGCLLLITPLPPDWMPASEQ
jgi:hypothetical protein